MKHKQRSKPSTKTTRILLLFLTIFLLPNIAQAALQTNLEEQPSYIIVNSNDFKDIYAGLLFARSIDVPADYLLAASYAEPVIQSIPEGIEKILLLEAENTKQVASFRRLLQNEGYEVNSIEDDQLPQRLAEILNYQKLFITDERYPSNAISLAPYVLQQEGFVLFVGGEQSLDELQDIIEEKPTPVTTYGLIDAQALQALQAYNIQSIEEGGKFANNIELVRRFLEEQPLNQIILTNGEFIEESLIDDFNPTLFIGRDTVPSQVEEYLADSSLTHGVLVGNHLSPTVQQLKERLKNIHGKQMNFVVKFAKTPRVQQTQFSVPSALEYFVLPIIQPQLSLVDITYNRLTKQLEVTYENPSAITVYFLASITIQSSEQTITLGDDEPRQVAPGQLKSILYPINLTDKEASVTFQAFYGDYPQSLEYNLNKEEEALATIEIADNAQLEILKIIYDKTNDAFFITIHNPSEVTTYANIELRDVIVEGLPTTIGTRTVQELKAQETAEVYIRAKLTDLDLLENDPLIVTAYYGQRKNVLFKTTQEELPLHVRILKPIYLVGIALGVAITLLALFLLLAKKKTYTCNRCADRIKTRSPPRRHSCGGKYRKG